MKTLKAVLAVTLSLLMSIFFTACKKNRDVVKKSDCRIIKVTPAPSSAGDPFTISYNTDGKVSVISSGNDITTFVYSGNTVFSTTTSSGVFYSKKIITLNPDGFAINVKTEYNTSGTDWNNEAYEYNGTELVKKITTASSIGIPIVTTFAWENGNLKSLSSAAFATTLEYHMDKPSQTGDYIYLAQLMEGYKIFKTKNLLKSSTSGPLHTNYSYNFDADGKITGLELTGLGGEMATYTYQYQCK